MAMQINISPDAEEAITSWATARGLDPKQVAQTVLEREFASNKSEILKVGLEHCRSLFEYHAGQRHTFHRYYFIVIALILSAFTSIFARNDSPHENLKWTAIAICVAGIVLTLFFFIMDRRNAHLVECDEALAKKIEESYWQQSGIKEFEIFKAAENYPRLGQYSVIIPAMFFVFAALCVAGIYFGWTFPWS